MLINIMYGNVRFKMRECFRISHTVEEYRCNIAHIGRSIRLTLCYRSKRYGFVKRKPKLAHTVIVTCRQLVIEVLIYNVKSICGILACIKLLIVLKGRKNIELVCIGEYISFHLIIFQLFILKTFLEFISISERLALLHEIFGTADTVILHHLSNLINSHTFGYLY